VPEPVLVELERVLKGKLGFTDERWDEVSDFLDRIAPERPRVPNRVERVTGDASDDEILACAVEAGAEVLVSGDRRHLLPVREHGGVRIVTAQALLAELA
jgi:uncharacterized protein